MSADRAFVMAILAGVFAAVSFMTEPLGPLFFAIFAVTMLLLGCIEYALGVDVTR